ncbi:MAG: hypothetical protein HY744_29285 [Deltaproteobacteria bacterium]|nr:hypothetical protein [Deltaproteobacteria bacterium]
MAASLGEHFLQLAIEPVERAGRTMLSGQIRAGIESLREDELLGAVDGAVRSVARTAGRPQSAIAGRLPYEELRAAAARVGRSQAQAAKQWLTHSWHVLLDGVVDLDKGPRPPTPSQCLLELAHQMASDKLLSTPLRAVGEDLRAWEHLLGRCRAALDADEILARAARRRRRAALVLGGLASVALGAFAAWAVDRQVARWRVQELLAGADPCAVEGIGRGDLGRASATQRRGIEQRLASCRRGREAALLAAQREREAAQERRAREARRQARARRCAAIIGAVQDGSFEPRPGDSDPAEAALLGRIAARDLTAADAKLLPEGLPCADTPEAARMRAAFAHALLASLWSWWRAGPLPPATERLIADSRGVLPERAVAVFGDHVESIADRALRSGEPPELDRARRLCELRAALGASGGQSCPAVAAYLRR